MSRFHTPLNSGFVNIASTFISFILIFSYIGYRFYKKYNQILYFILFFFIGFLIAFYFVLKELKKEERRQQKLKKKDSEN